MSDTTDPEGWETYRRQYVNHARAESLQEMLEEAGYFESIIDVGYIRRREDKLQVKGPLLNFLVDYLHFAETQEQVLDLPSLQEIVELAHALFEKEPRLAKR